MMISAHEEVHFDFTKEAEIRFRLENELRPPGHPQVPNEVYMYRDENLEQLMQALPPDEYGPYGKYLDPVLQRRYQRRFRLQQLANEGFAALPPEEQARYEKGVQERVESLPRRREERREAIRKLETELDDIAAQSTTNPTEATSSDDIPSFQKRYPDHEFAINESQLFFNWAVASCVTMDHVMSERSMLQQTIRQSNLPPGSTSPHFVDGQWMGWDQVRSCFSRKGAPEDTDEADYEAKWNKTGYYKVYPPNDEFEVSDPIEEEMDAIPFNVTSVRRFLQKIRDDLADAKWSKSSFLVNPKEEKRKLAGDVSPPPAAAFSHPTTVFTGDIEVYDSRTLSLVTSKGDRLEYWHPQDKYDHWGSYVVLQTAAGRLLILADAGAHPCVFCNLLEFFNSDGSGAMPRLFPDGYDSFDNVQLTAETLVESTLEGALSFLYHQDH